MTEVKFENNEVKVYQDGWNSPLLTINRKCYGDKGLIVDMSTCLTGTYEEAEDMARAYVKAFDMANEVL